MNTHETLLEIIFELSGELDSMEKLDRNRLRKLNIPIRTFNRIQKRIKELKEYIRIVGHVEKPGDKVFKYAVGREANRWVGTSLHKVKEFVKDGSHVITIHADLIQVIQEIDHLLGKKVTITGGVCSPAAKKVDNRIKAHRCGTAADVWIPNFEGCNNAEEIFEAAKIVRARLQQESEAGRIAPLILLAGEHFLHIQVLDRKTKIRYTEQISSIPGANCLEILEPSAGFLAMQEGTD